LIERRRASVQPERGVERGDRSDECVLWQASLNGLEVGDVQFGETEAGYTRASVTASPSIGEPATASTGR
jgi:hypothetical protein